MIFSVEKGLKDLGEKVTDEQRKEAEELTGKLRSAIEAKDFDTIRTVKADIEKVAHAFAEQAYAQPGADAAGAEEATEQADDNVVDAEYTEK